MNSKILTCVVGCLGLIGLSSCDDNWEPKTDTEGTLNMTGLGIDVSEIEKVISVEAAPKVQSRAESYDVNQFIVRITDATGAVVEEWSYASTPEVSTLKPGSYKLEIHSHEVQPAEWEKPYFHVSKDFTIVAGAIERIGTLTARLSNSAVSIRFDEELRKMAGDDVVVEVKANDEGSLTYTLDELRKGYFKILEGSSSMVVNFRGTVNGYKEDITLPTTDLEAGQHRIITFKAKVNPNNTPDETGTIDPSSGVGIDVSVTDEDVDGQITLEEDVEVVNPADRPGYQEPQDPPVGPVDPVDPSKPVATFTPGADLSVDSLNDYNEFGDGSEMAPGTKQALVSINCPGKFAKIEVDIVSEYLTDEFLTGVGLSSHFDLAHPNQFKSALVGFGFPVEDGVIGQTDVDFNITTLVPLLALSGDPDMVHKFIITVTDQNNQKATPLTLLFAGHK
ncbi:MAG: DUF4493 domain-containing protein [Muribaculaceae bacterium]|nr:DUF4493 domain-containing protein [Muribaculaceae bacterium]